MDFSTASQKEVFSESGVRMQMAHWDVPADVVLMDDAPHLASLGARVIHGGHTLGKPTDASYCSGWDELHRYPRPGWRGANIQPRHGEAWGLMRYL